MKSTHLFALVIGRPGAFRGDFQYDDVSTILENPHLDPWDIFVGIQGPPHAPLHRVTRKTECARRYSQFIVRTTRNRAFPLNIRS